MKEEKLTIKLTSEMQMIIDMIMLDKLAAANITVAVEFALRVWYKK